MAPRTKIAPRRSAMNSTPQRRTRKKSSITINLYSLGCEERATMVPSHGRIHVTSVRSLIASDIDGGRSFTRGVMKLIGSIHPHALQPNRSLKKAIQSPVTTGAHETHSRRPPPAGSWSYESSLNEGVEKVQTGRLFVCGPSDHSDPRP